MTDIEKTMATLKGIPTRDEMFAQLQENVAEVTFNKLNGDQRVMTCTLVPIYLPSATKTDTMSQKKVRELNEQVISVWDVNAQGWRSFRYERVTDFKLVDWTDSVISGD